MELEEYADVFKEIDKAGLLTEDDRRFLVQKGILTSQKVVSVVSCPTCNTPLPKEMVKKLVELLVDRICEDKGRIAESICEEGTGGQDKHPDSIMFG